MDYHQNEVPEHDLVIEGKTIEEREREFTEFKMQQRRMLEKKAQIQKRIESMKREFDFIKNLDTKDVGYVLSQKQDHYARLIQRGIRRFLARRRLERRGQRAELAEEDMEDPKRKAAREKREAENKKYYKEATDFAFVKHKDLFKDKISDKRREELSKLILE